MQACFFFFFLFFFWLSEVLQSKCVILRKLSKCTQFSDFDSCRFCFDEEKEEVKQFRLDNTWQDFYVYVCKVTWNPAITHHFFFDPLSLFISYIHTVIPASVSLHPSVLFICPLPLSRQQSSASRQMFISGNGRRGCICLHECVCVCATQGQLVHHDARCWIT